MSKLQYFRRLGACQCGKPATGWLMNDRNEQHRVSCERCAEKALRPTTQGEKTNDPTD